MKKFLSVYKVHLLVTLILLAIAAGIPFDSYYAREFLVSEMELRPEAAGTALFTEGEEPVLKAESGSGYTGIVAETVHVTLQKGSYRLQVVSLSESEQNYIEIYRDRKSVV